MPQKIIISSMPEEARMGLIKDDMLQEYLVERSLSEMCIRDRGVCGVMGG